MTTLIRLLRPRLEPLEGRVLLSSSSFTVRLTLENGVLTVDATRPRNSVQFGISEDGTRIVFDEAGRERQWPRSALRRIVINGGRRGDDIECAYGTPVPVTINARAGGDYLSGGSAADRIDGGPGDDTFADNFGADTLIGGSGDDVATFFSRGADLTITLDGRANDGQDLGTGPESMNVGADIERVTGGQGNDRIVGSAADNVLDGYTGDDTVTGGGGADQLLGNYGDDYLYARDSVVDRVGGGPGFDRAQADRGNVPKGVEERID
jgi:Ca2+-binding RTX toxin-like protein